MGLHAREGCMITHALRADLDLRFDFGFQIGEDQTGACPNRRSAKYACYVTLEE